MRSEKKKYQLLVVEDNPGDFLLLKEYLELTQLPFAGILHAGNMKEATEIAGSHVVDLVLLDLSLPDSAGTDSVISLDHLLPNIPIVVFSGLSTLEIAREAISVGAQDYLVKGEFDERLLAKAIEYSVERKRTQENLRKSFKLYEFVNKATQDTIWDWNFPNQQGSWGEGIVSTFGYAPDQRHFNRDSVMTYIHPEDLALVLDCFRSHISTGEANCDLEFRFHCADSSFKHVHCRAYIIYENQQPTRIIGSLSDITDRKLLESKLAEQQLNQQRLITESTIQAQEEERNEIGRELHDNINQILATVKMYLGMARAGRQVPEDLLGKSYEYVEEAMMEIRSLSHALVAPSLGDIGLKDALETLVENTNTGADYTVELVFENDEECTTSDKHKELMLYRIIQEQLNNISKYAKATEARIELKCLPDKYHLRVEDNGIGFDLSQKAKGIGLKNIRNRVQFYGGTLHIDTAPGKGCKTEIIIPN